MHFKDRFVSRVIWFERGLKRRTNEKAGGSEEKRELEKVGGRKGRWEERQVGRN